MNGYQWAVISEQLSVSSNWRLPFGFGIEGFRNAFGDPADARDFFGGENLLPVVEAGAAVEFDGVGFVPGKFRRVLGTAGVFDGVSGALCEIQAEGFV